MNFCIGRCFRGLRLEKGRGLRSDPHYQSNLDRQLHSRGIFEVTCGNTHSSFQGRSRLCASSIQVSSNCENCNSLRTGFRIDTFHAEGHTKCAPATFLSTYSAANPELTAINTSAGECGNSGLLKIRKSVSYMSQDRAIMYTNVYLAVWNRQRIRKLKGLSK